MSRLYIASRRVSRNNPILSRPLLSFTSLSLFFPSRATSPAIYTRSGWRKLSGKQQTKLVIFYLASCPRALSAFGFGIFSIYLLVSPTSLEGFPAQRTGRVSLACFVFHASCIFLIRFWACLSWKTVWPNNSLTAVRMIVNAVLYSLISRERGLCLQRLHLRSELYL